MKMLRLFIISCLLLGFYTGTLKAQISIIPQPVKVSTLRGSYLLSGKATISVDDQSRLTGIYLQNYLSKYYGFNLKVKVYKRIPAGAAIQLATASGTEGEYSLVINRSGIKITGDGAGVFYGVQSLIQMLPDPGSRPLRLTACMINNDKPRFKWRGLSLDVSRHFFTVEEVKKYIDIMAHYKLNVFHWHLTDDEGWRIQIDKYPRLTELGSKIGFYSGQGKFRKLDNLVDNGRDGFYTKDDIREVLNYAASRYVTVLPEIEMPGHSEAAIFAYPELGCQDSTGAKHRVRMLDPSENTFKFLENVLTEVIALFPNPYVHIGGDEAEMADWLKSPAAVALMRREGLKNEKEIQSYFIKRIEKFLLSKNKKLIGWDEILQGGLAQSATVMSWQGEAGGIAAAKMHHPVVMTPLPQMYFDAPQANEQLEPVGWNPPVPWQMVYNYEPQSKELNTDEATYILGAQGNIWTEKVPNLLHLEYMVYPRALAVAELSWSVGEEKNIDRFANKLVHQYRLFKLWNLNARLPDIGTVINTVTNKNNFTTTLQYPLAGALLRYSLNGVMPDSTAAACTFPLKISSSLKDSLIVSTYITWTLNRQHIKQQAVIRKVLIDTVAISKASLKQGVVYKVYQTPEGSDNSKLDSLVPLKTGVLNTLQASEWAQVDSNEDTQVKISGFINIDSEGDYELTSKFAKSPEVYLGDVLIINRDKDRYAEPQRAWLHLKKGCYAFKGFFDGKNSPDDAFLQIKTSSGRVLEPTTYLFH